MQGVTRDMSNVGQGQKVGKTKVTDGGKEGRVSTANKSRMGRMTGLNPVEDLRSFLML